jgi:hypothetical protein
MFSSSFQLIKACRAIQLGVADTGVDYRSVGNTEESVFVSN